jgi:small subunit ribosomal protein S6
MTKLYELVVLLHPDLEIDAETPIAKIEKLIEAVKGRVTKRDNWGKKRLAYKIAKHDFAVYVYFEVELETSAVRELERTLLITEEVIRHILVVHEEAPARPAKPEGKSDDKAAEAAEEESKAPATAEEGE